MRGDGFLFVGGLIVYENQKNGGGNQLGRSPTKNFSLLINSGVTWVPPF